ncbi:MAG TPA: cytochrome c [Gemmatimonadaceae bacterium]|nr:cytochrome c [Gemmatimonadaceae bacterium]
MTRRLLKFAFPTAVLLTASAFYMGGWAVLSVQDLPDYATVGAPVNLEYIALQHGVDPLDKLDGEIVARSGSSVVRVTAREARRAHYTASITLPSAGDWTIAINSGFGNSNARLMPLRAVDEKSAPPTVTDTERGRRLFVAKGCITCHVHNAVDPEGTLQLKQVGPDLTTKRYATEYLKMFLKDPSIRPPSSPNAMRMPNLGLKPAEIAALAAFVNDGRAVTSTR